MNLRGVFPPVLTPFKRDGHLDLDALQFNLRKYVQTDLAGFVLLGSYGESVYLQEEEKLAVIKAARDVIPSDKLLIAGTGVETTAGTQRLTWAAVDLGVDAVIVLTPHFYIPLMQPETLKRYFTTIADTSPVPVLLYNVPLFTHVDLTIETIIALSTHENIPGMKESSGNVVKIAQILTSSPDFQVLTGSGSAFLAGLTIGACGGVMGMANIAPAELLQMMSLVSDGQIDTAAAIQRRLVQVDRAITFTYGIAGAKAALDLLGYHGGSVRAPLVDLDLHQREAMKEILINAQLIKEKES